MPKSQHVLKKIRELCLARGFVYERENSHLLPQLHSCHYGPLGVEIKRNLLSKWWHETVISRKNVHGIELTLPDQPSCWKRNHDQGQHLEERPSYLSDVIGIALKIINGEESIGLAHCLKTVNNNNVDQFLFNFQEKEFYELCFFCPTKKVNNWMDYWMRKRLSWWKKYADIPGEFSLVDGDFREEFSQNNDVALTDTMAVQYNFPWGSEAMECITSYSDIGIWMNKSSLPNIEMGVIIARMSIERGLLGYLLDAYHEHESITTERNVAKHTILRLHPALAPVKVAIISLETINTDLGHVAQQLTTELRQAGINSHHFQVGCSLDVDKLTLGEDMIGTPYTVLIQDSTLTNGIVMLRNRDTTLSEYLHISEILKTVQQHFYNI